MFSIVPQSAESGPSSTVGAVSVTVTVAPGCMSPRSQVSVPSTMSHAWLSTLQAKPAGSTSVRTTSNATPSPMFVTVISKTRSSPTWIGVFAAVFSTSMSGQLSVTESDASPEPSFTVVIAAVLS